MGHGPSTSSSKMKSRTDSFVNGHPDPRNNDESFSTQNEDSSNNDHALPVGSRSLRSKSYLSYRRSTASLSKLFQKRKWKQRRGSISASFNINENDIKVELMNVNTATEDELMTLHGVNRALARTIINHRELIGGFRKIEDLALVSGMGASKLDQLRPEICISKRKPGLSRASSKVPSLESIPSTAESTRIAAGSSSSRFTRLVNVNSATMFDLMSVEGINQATAARIINYRENKGTIKYLDDLRRVGISLKRLSAIKAYLTTEDLDSDLSSTVSSNSPGRTPKHPNGKGHVRSLSVPVELVSPSDKKLTSHFPETMDPTIEESDLSEPDTLLQEIYDLMSLKTARPLYVSNFNFYHNGCSAYRVATWNMEKLTADKISNPGVMEVITRTILENRFSILAIQEICEKTALEKICNELNNPQLYCNRKWGGYRGMWKYALHESVMNVNKVNHYLGVIYDSQRIDEVTVPKLKEFCPIQNGSLWQFATFKITVRDNSWVLINLLSVGLESGKHVMNGSVSHTQQQAMEAVMNLVEDTQGAMIIGSFNGQQALKGLKAVEDMELVYPLKEDEETKAIPSSICVSKGLKPNYSGEQGVVESGLTHPAIPNGWNWGGRISSNGPLYCTMYDVSDPKDNSSDDELKIVRTNSEDGDDYVPAR